MATRTIICFLAALLSLTWIWAAGIATPVAGYIACAPTPELRAILGVPGALRYSDPLRLPPGTVLVRAAPGRDFAWVERAEAPPAVLSLGGGAVERITPVEGAVSSSDWMAFSPNGAAAVLFSSKSARLQVLAGLPDTPRVALDLDAALLPEPPSTAAVSDDAATLLVSSPGTVSLVQGATARVVLSGQRFVSVAIMPNGRDAVAADAGTGSVFLLQDAGSRPARTLVSGLPGIGAVAPSGDGAVLIASRPEARELSIIDVASGSVQSYAVRVTPAALHLLGIRDSFLISSNPAETGWIFMRQGSGASTVFIPAASAASKRNPKGARQ